MMDVSITWKNKQGSIKVNRFNRGAKKRLQKGLAKMGMLVVREEKKALKNSNPTTFFYKSPHAELRSRTGALRASINMQLGQLSLKVGPGGSPARYGMVHEYGALITVTEKMRRFLHAMGIHLKASTDTIKIPKRPWFWPTWLRIKEEAIRLVQQEVNKPLR